MIRKITPHLWFDKEAREASEFYVSTFGQGSKITNITTLHNTPSGDADIVSFELMGYPFMCISGGPLFKINPSISFTVICNTKEDVDALWNKLIVGGKALMELDTYPFSERYGWLQDKYGLSWQIIVNAPGMPSEKISPVLMFTKELVGKAEEAINFYVSVFKNSKLGDIFRYTKGQEPDKEGTVAHAFFTLEGQDFAALESAREHEFIFNEAISLMVSCKDQEEIDYYWEKLSAVPESEQCGWLKDKYGVSWQIVPEDMGELMSGDQARIDRVTQALLPMKKFNLQALKAAAEGK